MSKKTMSRQGKKKMTRNILIGVAIAAVVAVAVFLIVALQPDGAGMNCFQRNATVASADGVSVNMKEYRVTFDSDQTVQMAKQYEISVGSMLKEIQENAAQEALLQKIYMKEGKALGITLTKEEQDECRKNAEELVSAREASIKSQMATSGSYSKTAFEKQLAAYYESIGMNRNEYTAFIRQSLEQDLYRQKLVERVTSENTLEGDDLLKYYRETVEESMLTSYEAGQFWKKLDTFRAGTGKPLKYLPEGFILIDFIKLEVESTEEAEKIAEEVKAGTRSFDELKASADNKDAFRDKVQGPYPIAKDDHAELFKDEEVFTKAEALQNGEIDYFIPQIESDETETKTVTLYLFRRAEGTICMDGDSGVINIDWFAGMRETVKNEYIEAKWNELQERWLSDVKYEDAVYTYDGGLA